LISWALEAACASNTHRLCHIGSAGHNRQITNCAVVGDPHSMAHIQPVGGLGFTDIAAATSRAMNVPIRIGRPGP
jgi:hypothetical protein